MANSTIPNLVAVTVPAVTDLFGVRQSGDTRDKKLTVTQLLTLIPGVPDPLLLGAGAVGAPTYSFTGDPDTGVFNSAADQLALTAGGKEIARCQEVVGAEQFIVSPGFVENNPALPALAFGNGDTGFFESTDNSLDVSVGGVASFKWSGSIFRANTGLGAAMQNESASATNPTLIPSVQDQDSGIGSNAVDQVSIIAGGVEIARATEVVGSEQFAVIQNDNTGVPDLAGLGDPDTGFRWTGGNQVVFVGGGSGSWNFISTAFFASASDGPILFNTFGSPTVPSICVERTDIDTGLGRGGNDSISLISGGVEGLRLWEQNSGVVQAPDAATTITAFATGGQVSATQLNSSYNVIGTVATTGDSVKLPLSFIRGSVVFVKNDGVNAADVFPAVGDDLGAGLNTAVSLAAGESASFIATAENLTWTPWIVSVGGGGGGDVTKVGTPVNNQVGVWTGDGTLEGDVDLTFDGTILTTGLTGRVRTGVGTTSQAAFGFATEINTGIYRQGAGSLGITLSGSGNWLFQAGSFFANVGSGPQLMAEAATATNPTFVPRLSDTDSGIGSNAADQVSIIAGGAEGIRVAEAGAVITNTIFGNLVAAGGGGAGPMMKNEGPSSTNPVFVPNQADPDTGLTRSGVDRLGLIAGGLECLSVRETAGARQVGFYTTAPVSQSAAYSRAATIVESRALLASASATTLNNNNVLAALIADLQAVGLIG